MHALIMSCFHEMLEIGQGTELRVHAVIIFYRVRAAQAALAIFYTNFLNRHQP